MRTLVIGNKCYSSWSMRPWLLMKQLGIPFEEKQILLDRPETAAEIARYSPAGRVPVLVDGDRTVWDSVAIIEHLAETTEAPVWPTEPRARARARSVAAEMHAGFAHLREAFPMNFGKRYAYRERPEAAEDLRRIFQIFGETPQQHADGGPFLFGAFSAADAMYAPVVARLDTYCVPVPPAVRAYMDAVWDLPAFQEWRTAGLQEPWVLADDEVKDEPIEVLRTALA